MNPKETGSKLSWTEYKTIRQYQTIGDVLDIMMIYGCEVLVGQEMNIENQANTSSSNGHFWLTKDPPR